MATSTVSALAECWDPDLVFRMPACIGFSRELWHGVEAERERERDCLLLEVCRVESHFHPLLAL